MAEIVGAVENNSYDFEDAEKSYDGTDDELEDADQKKHRHDKLLRAIASLDDQTQNRGLASASASQRSEPSTTVSEFTVTDGGHDKIKLHELVLSLGKSAGHAELKKQIRRTQRQQKVLPVPLPKSQTERIKRKFVYEKVSDDLDKWDNLVQQNRSSQHLVFPLKKSNVRLEPGSSLSKRFKPTTPLELEVAELLNGSKNVLRDDCEMTVAEEERLQAMSLKDALARRHELQKYRALESYVAAKARRQNKIKSKRYHRVLKRERTKKQVREFEKMKDDDPDQALQQLELLDEKRITERMTLKHSNTGKWAKQMGLRAKYNEESRIALREQLRLGKKLRGVRSTPTEQDDDLNEGNEAKKNTSWSGGDQHSKEEQINQIIPVTRIGLKKCPPKNDSSLKQPATKCGRPPIPTQLIGKDNGLIAKDFRNKNASGGKVVKNKFPPKMKNIQSSIPMHVGVANEMVDEKGEFLDEINIMMPMDSKAKPDILTEFMKEKEEIIKRDAPTAKDSFLPGWGEWAGAGIKPNTRKHRRFVVPAPTGKPRKDRNINNVIISEKVNAKLVSLQVNRKTPFPFKTIKAFEHSMQAPIGHHWNTETAYRKLISPLVVTKMGTSIEPIDKDALLKKKDCFEEGGVDNSEADIQEVINKERKKMADKYRAEQQKAAGQKKKKRFNKKHHKK